MTYTEEAKQAQGYSDSQRLDFIIDNPSWIQSTKTDAGGVAYQLWTQNEDEEFYTLHASTEFFKTPRAVIDAAIKQGNE